ncbi:tetratricopeptide repeat protein [Bacteroidales bacterium OttesenSCG-928-I14]|nr:tetratricopeptide repeat protein [Bacteroidales bacterium OttesenSCG-928-I14]
MNKECDALLKSAIEAAENKDFISSFESLSSAKVLAEDNNLYLQQFWIFTNMGINYAEMLDYSEALDSFLEAYKIALKHLGTRNEMSILNNIAGLYYLDQKFDKAEEYYRKIYKYAEESKDSILWGGSALNLSMITNQCDRLVEAKSYLDIAEEMLQENPKSLIQVYTLRIALLIREENYAAAEALAIELLPQVEDVEMQDSRIVILTDMARIYSHKREYNKAISYIHQVMSINPNLENKIALYDLLSDIYRNKGEYNTALNYKDSIIYAADSLQVINNSKHFENNRIKFELLKNEQELLGSKLELKNQRLIFIFVIIVAVVLIWAFVTNSIKEKQRKKIIQLELEHEKSKKLLLEKQYEEQETQSLLEKERLVSEQEKLRREIEAKNRELAAKVLFLSNRNELIENIVDSLSNSPEIANNPDALRNIRQLKTQLKNNAEQDNFLSHFENVNPEYIRALREKHANLTANEIRFLSYIYINLNSKEISSLLNITPEYCKKKKQQIARKMGLETTSHLYSYLSELG